MCSIIRLRQKLQRPSGCYRKAVTILALNRHRHGSSQCSSSRFTHFACISLQGFASSTPFVSFRLHSFQPLSVHPLPVLGSPAGRHRLRGCHAFCNLPMCLQSFHYVRLFFVRSLLITPSLHSTTSSPHARVTVSIYFT